MARGNDAPQEQVPGSTPRREFTPGRLQETLEDHERWVRSRGRDGKRAELFEAALGRASLRNALLTEANLQGADLEQAFLTGARLQGADLQRASLRGADLQRAALHRANLQGADCFEANLEGAGLYEANLQAVNFLAANLQHADLQRASLQRAFLKEANLQEAELQGANLQGANLQQADLFGAALQRVVLREANLSGANLRDTNLQGAELLGSNLQEAALQQANLRDADLSGSTGLIASQLAGADVAGARLPESVSTFAGLGTIQALTQQARRLFLLLLLGCVVAWLSIAATTDVMLLTNASIALLPQVNIPIPSLSFYKVMPVLLLLLFIYFHLHLQRLWEDMAVLPAIFPDGRPLDRTVYPWLLHGLVRVYSWRLQYHRPPLSRLQMGIWILLAWWLVPGTLVLFWIRYLPRHDWFGTIVHIALLASAIGFAVLFQSLARTVLLGRLWRRYKHGAVALLTAFAFHVILSVLSFGALAGVPPSLYTSHTPQQGLAPRLSETDIRRLVPRLLALIGYSPFANLAEADVSTKLPSCADQEHTPPPLVTGALLQDSNLRYANAIGAFLVKADLRHADLFGADLRQADLRGANLEGTNLRLASLQGADLRHTSGLTKAQIAAAFTDTTTLLPAALRTALSPESQDQ
jgi:uncharacterized protein YjbI with pentapeptide repeats